MTDDTLDTIIDFSEDISDAEAPPPLPRNDYEAEVRGVQVAVSKNKGTRYADVTFLIRPEQFPADFDPTYYPDGITMHYRRVTLEDTPQARYSVRMFCEAIGAPMSKRIDINDWIGQSARVTVTHETYEGRERATIQTVAPLE